MLSSRGQAGLEAKILSSDSPQRIVLGLEHLSLTFYFGHVKMSVMDWLVQCFTSPPTQCNDGTGNRC